MGHCRMAPLKLKELRKQLKELLDMEFMQASKASYNKLVLFKKTTGPSQYV